MAYRLPRLSDNAPIAGKNGVPTFVFVRWWQSLVKAIEDALNSLQDAITAVAAAQAAADAANAAAAAAQTAADDAATAASDANTAATTANTAAGNAQDAADTAAAEISLNNSYVSPDNILTATDAGSNATISIDAHTRYYGDGTSVSVNSGSVTGLSYSTGYSIYYVQASRAGGAVTYQATTNPATAAQTGDTHLVGAITTPAAAAGPTSGGVVLPAKLADVYTYL